MPADDGGEALVHYVMLPGAGQRDNYPRHGGGNGAEATAGGVYCCGYLNVDLGKEGGWVRDKDITAAVATEGLEGHAGHLFPRWQVWCRYRRTWATVRQGTAVSSWTDYILRSDRRIFQNVAVWDPRQNSNHFMVVGCLCESSSR